MEELKTILNVIKDLPDTALWVLGGYLLWKMFIAGSIVGSIYSAYKLTVEKLHDYKSQAFDIEKRVRKQIEDEYGSVDMFGTIDGITISTHTDQLIRQIKRLRRISDKGDEGASAYEYIHLSDIRWLESAIDEKLKREKK